MQQWGVGRLNVFEISHWFSPVYNIHLITFTECVSLLSWTNQNIPRHFIYNVFIFKLKIAPTTSLSIQRTMRRFVIGFQVNSNCISSAILFEKSCQKEKQCRSRHVVVLFEGCCFSARADLFTRKKKKLSPLSLYRGSHKPQVGLDYNRKRNKNRTAQQCVVVFVGRNEKKGMTIKTVDVSSCL